MKQPHTDLHQYRTLGLPLLGLMGVIALAGIILTAILAYI